MKIGIFKVPDNNNYGIAYQHGDFPSPSDDVVLQNSSPQKCLRDLATWLDIKNNVTNHFL